MRSGRPCSLECDLIPGDGGGPGIILPKWRRLAVTRRGDSAILAACCVEEGRAQRPQSTGRGRMATIVRVRKDVYKLASTDKTLEWYGKAINELKKRLIKDPTSWRYQAAIHGYDRSEDPLKKSSDVLPS